jgi:hypothetical protein
MMLHNYMDFLLLLIGTNMTESTKRKLEYQKKYNARPEEVAKRVKNNAARRKAMEEGRVSKGDSKDVAHKKALDNGGGNGKGNTVVSKPKSQPQLAQRQKRI